MISTRPGLTTKAAGTENEAAQIGLVERSEVSRDAMVKALRLVAALQPHCELNDRFLTCGVF